MSLTLLVGLLAACVTTQAPGAASAGPAPGSDDAVTALHDRVARLERRLADMDARLGLLVARGAQRLPGAVTAGRGSVDGPSPADAAFPRAPSAAPLVEGSMGGLADGDVLGAMGSRSFDLVERRPSADFGLAADASYVVDEGLPDPDRVQGAASDLSRRPASSDGGSNRSSDRGAAEVVTVSRAVNHIVNHTVADTMAGTVADTMAGTVADTVADTVAGMPADAPDDAVTVTDDGEPPVVIRMRGTPDRAGSQPASSTSATSIDDTYAAAHALLREGSLTDALGLFEGIVALAGPHRLVDNAMYWTGFVHAQRRDLRRAIGVWQRLPLRFPRSAKVPDALFGMAVAHETLGEPALAEILYAQLLAQHPRAEKAPEARRALARLRPR